VILRTADTSSVPAVGITKKKGPRGHVTSKHRKSPTLGRISGWQKHSTSAHAKGFVSCQLQKIAVPEGAGAQQLFPRHKIDSDGGNSSSAAGQIRRSWIGSAPGPKRSNWQREERAAARRSLTPF